jgi:hypothetical protein
MITNNFIILVEKIHQHTNSPLKNDAPTLVLAKMIEELKLKCHQEIHNLNRYSLQLKEQLQDNLHYHNFNYGLQSATDLASAVSGIDRNKEFLFSMLQSILKPVWRVYWNSDNCLSYNLIEIWLQKAEEDGGQKVMEFLKRQQ